MAGDVIQGLDLMEVLYLIARKSKKYQAIFLQDLEKIIDDKEKFNEVRKLFLNAFNNYTRFVLRIIFGDDFESINK